MQLGPVVLLEAQTPSSSPYTSQRFLHLSPTEPHWSLGSRFLFQSKLDLYHHRMSMVGSKDKPYNSYFAKSPGQSDSTRTSSTDKTKGKSKSVSQSSSTANSSVDPNGNSKTTSSTKSHSKPGVSSSKKADPSSNAPHSSKRSQPDGRKGGLDSPSTISRTSMDSTSPSGSNATSRSSLSQSLLNKKKKEIVDKIMVDVFHPLFNQWLDQSLGVMSHAGDGTQSGTPQSSGRGSKRTGGQKRQYQRDEQDDAPEDNDRGDDGGHNNTTKRARRGSDSKQKFACPFFKHNQDKYKHVRTCCGPGWLDVHRVKEHIYRRHALPEFICNRCCTVFKDENALKGHQRSQTPCPLKKEHQNDGFDKSQEKLLRSRNAGPGSERQKWEEMYRILFPDDLVPSPYYDDKSRADTNGNGKGVDCRDLAEYEQYLRRELPPIVRKQLDREVEKQLNCVEDKMKDKVVEIFRDVQLKLFRTFKFQATQSQPTTSGSIKAEEGRKLSPEPSIPPEVGPSAVVDEPDFAAMLEVGNFDLGDYFGMQQPLEWYDSQTTTSDSAYGSMSNVYSFGGTETTL